MDLEDNIFLRFQKIYDIHWIHNFEKSASNADENSEDSNALAFHLISLILGEDSICDTPS